MRLSVLLQLTLCSLFVATPPAMASAKSAARIHVVGSGERLDSIAKRYRVGAEELRRANDLRRSATLKRGQRLTIPNLERPVAAGARTRPAVEEKGKTSLVKASASAGSAAPIRHRVTRGETLAQIAHRYSTNVEKLAASNGLVRGQRVRDGQVLKLPSVSRSSPKSWHVYAKPAKRPGHLALSTHSARFSGRVLDSEGRLRTSAVRAINGLLGAGGSHPTLPERLIRLLVEVSDTFGGRSIRVVSGYRTASYYEDSRHKLSSAVDFLVVGVPNAVVCDYLRELEDVGVGYYPNSSFVHLDVRNHSAYWVDYAGPGEPPRSTPNAPAVPAAPRAPRAPNRADRKLLADLDGVLENVKGAIESAKTATSDATPALAEALTEMRARTARRDEPAPLRSP